MADAVLTPTLTPPSPRGRYGAGLAEAEVRRFQAILREQCGHEVVLSEAWSRAIEFVSLVEMLLDSTGAVSPDGGVQRVRAPSHLTDSRS